ncbi:hypothetical protein T552_02783 [Pneumocystis carinii B80]|uniref:Protein BFR2 n=1 Tax=Pneumocystis carinii (strain B80) TaxID=1408658 RepID=A0A0W4ZEJ4_PNEC8|nr:hypothetical protein T552_02783 [Pneumocystis carinii B80]KTW26782.1 hypothetical protein T552_02783 [Pneumocystis carinii B80]
MGVLMFKCLDTLDPEDIIDENCWSDSITSSDESYTGREHYLTVGKKRIRDDDLILEDEKYIGKKANLKDIYEDDYDRLDDKIKYNEISDKDEEISSSIGLDEDLSHQEANLSEFSDDIIDEESEKKRRKELKSFIENEEKNFVQEIAKMNSIEIEKGEHIQRQLKMYDCLLDARIRLQKALVAVNSLSIEYKINELEENKEFVKNAENETNSLIECLSEIRKMLMEMDKIDVECAVERNKDISKSSLETLCDDVLNLDKQILTWQNETLLKWSDKVKVTSVLSLNKFNSLNQNVLDLIQRNMTNKEKLLEATYIDRTEKKQPKNKERFDDTDFYQALLFNLISKRMVDSGNNQGLRWAFLKQKKQKNNIDTKASKGRRLRYHVHEKIQNFMTPNPVNIWIEEKIDNLFSSLFGQISSNDIVKTCN